jgi:hypothetical protein
MNLRIFLVWDGFVFRDHIITRIIVSFSFHFWGPILENHGMLLSLQISFFFIESGMPLFSRIGPLVLQIPS